MESLLTTMPLSGDGRRLLELLANTGPRGVTEAALIADDITARALAGFLRVGWATVASETLRAGGKVVHVRRYRITDAGRRAIGDWTPSDARFPTRLNS